MNRRFTAIVYITLAILLAVSGTLAQFSDTKISSGNTFEAGSMKLYMHDGDEDISAEWVMENMIPGVTEFTGGNLQLYNRGTVSANNVKISFNTKCTESGGAISDGVICKYIKIKRMTYKTPGSGSSQVKLVDDYGKATPALYTAIPGFAPYSNNDYVDLEDLDGKTIAGLPAPPAGGETSTKHCDFAMDTYFDESATDECQGDTCELILTFTMNQK